ncbi:MAG: HAD-IA family hydrolase [Chlamydiae bacterium]|nr:HAD-IA family hydrolase [Chlamydiota bacterium]
MISLFLLPLALFGKANGTVDTPANKVQTVIFDFGNVVVQKDTRLVEAFLSQELEISEETAKEILKERKEALLQGIEDKTFFKNIFKNFGKEMPSSFLKQFKKEIKGSILIDKKVFKIIQALKKQKNVILFSNTEKHKADLYKELGYYEPFEELILSYEIGLRKPQKEAYQFVIETIGVEPYRCLFIDDKLENILVAKKQSWNAIWFHDAEQLEKELYDLGFRLDCDPIGDETVPF